VTAPTARRAVPPKPTFGSLFAGIGGLDLGLERAGWECRWQVEIDNYCRRVLAKHWPDVPRFGDIRTVTGGELERVDLICGGFPCQDISNAGKRAGIDGERSGLWSEYIRLVRVVRPRLVLVENVAALLTRGLDRVLGDLAEAGYDAEWRCLSAAAFGAPHRRERLFIVAEHDRHANPYILGADADFPHAEDFQWWRGRLHELGAGDGIQRGDSYAGIRRTVDGIPHWVERIGGLGNAVVPQVAEWIGRRLLEAMA
jgi:DNA (cytosine-5)-methyltransferase 1